MDCQLIVSLVLNVTFQEWDLATKREKMQTNLVGEMTVLNFKENRKLSMLGLPGVEAPGINVMALAFFVINAEAK
jgi:hypothetical protein